MIMQNIACRVCGKSVDKSNSTVNYHDACMEKLQAGKATTLKRKMYIQK